MKAIDLSNVNEASEFKRVTAGAYICTITAVEDVAAKEYLKVTYDIAEGEFKGTYTKIRTENPDWVWVGAYVKSYKPKALPMLKRFCSAVSKSNGNYVFDAGNVNSDETTLVGKKIGLIFREEEYWGDDGEKKTRLKVYSEFPVSEIAKQRVPEKIKVSDDDMPADKNSDFVNVNNDNGEDMSEVPFE